MTDRKKVDLGDHVKDVISGFAGIATGVFKYLNGCTRVCVTPRTVKDGKLLDEMVFDETQLTIVKRAAVTAAMSAHAGTAGPGGPRKDPPRVKSPAR